MYTGFEMLFVYFGAFSQQVRDLMAYAFVLSCCCPRLNAAFSDALAELVLFLCRPTLFWHCALSHVSAWFKRLNTGWLGEKWNI